MHIRYLLDRYYVTLATPGVPPYDWRRDARYIRFCNIIADIISPKQEARIDGGTDHG